jgi:hypothetical protein
MTWERAEGGRCRDTAPEHHACVARPWGDDLGEGAGRELAEALRVNTTLTSLNLGCNALEEGGGRALAEALRLNTTERERETERLKEFVRNNRIGM